MGKDPLVTEGPERKSNATRVVHLDDLSKEKKSKVEEETKALSVLMATYLGLVEVVELGPMNLVSWNY